MRGCLRQRCLNLWLWCKRALCPTGREGSRRDAAFSCREHCIAKDCPYDRSAIGGERHADLWPDGERDKPPQRCIRDGTLAPGPPQTSWPVNLMERSSQRTLVQTPSNGVLQWSPSASLTSLLSAVPSEDFDLPVPGPQDNAWPTRTMTGKPQQLGGQSSESRKWSPPASLTSLLSVVPPEDLDLLARPPQSNWTAQNMPLSLQSVLVQSSSSKSLQRKWSPSASLTSLLSAVPSEDDDAPALGPHQSARPVHNMPGSLSRSLVPSPSISSLQGSIGQSPSTGSLHAVTWVVEQVVDFGLTGLHEDDSMHEMTSTLWYPIRKWLNLDPPIDPRDDRRRGDNAKSSQTLQTQPFGLWKNFSPFGACWKEPLSRPLSATPSIENL